MAEILDEESLSDGGKLLIVASSTSRGRHHHHYVVRLVETDGSPWRNVRAKNVRRVINNVWADGRCRGPNSGWHATVESLRRAMAAAADGKEE